ncbi:MAG TPA: glycosyltransferase [Methylococcaceae bacterium]|nr:glycosyltransferase [Methylococcaceae bacterium]
MLKILHVVRRYGPVGGMERYVWELTHALADLDIEIHIICEETFRVTAHNNIHIHTLGALPPRPRWLSMLRFSHRVTKWVKDNANKNFIIHSHERTNVHHITTFHSAVFANIRQKPWWKRISIRIAIWLYLEKRELSGKQVQIILPNSDAIKEELSNAYPKTQKALHNPAYPGSHSTPQNTKKHNTSSDTKIIIFIGQEWQRKGLKKATLIIKELRKTIPKLELWVFGPSPQDIEHLFQDCMSGYKLFGWTDAMPFLAKAHLLLHPATSEPYGMAIAEASASGVPVVISDQCGISSQVTHQSGRVININAVIGDWVNACLTELNRTTPTITINHSWLELAEQHLKIYSNVAIKDDHQKI